MKIIKYILYSAFIFCFSKQAFPSNNIDSLFNELNKAKNDTTIWSLYLKMGDYYESFNPDSAFYFYKKSLNHALRKKLKKQEATSLLYLGFVYEDIGAFEKAIAYYSTALKKYEKIKDAVGLSRCYNNIGIAYSYLGNNSKAMSFFNIALKLFQRLKDKNGIANCLINIGLIYSDEGNYDNALKYLQTALNIFKENNDKIGTSGCYVNIGNIYHKKGADDKALDCFINALKIDESLGDLSDMSVCYLNVGIIYSNQGNNDKAIEYYHKSLEISEKIGDQYGIATCYNNIGGIYRTQNNVKKAIEYYQKSLKIHEALGDKLGIASCYNNIGGSYKYFGNYEKALEYYQKSLKIKEELKDKNGIALVYGNIANLYITITDSTRLNENQKKEYLLKAIDYATKALILGKEINALPKENEASMHLLMAYKRMGNYKKALEFAEKYIETRDSLFSSEKTKALAEMVTKYEAEKKQLQVEKLQKQKELDKKTIEAKTAENKRQQYIIFSSIAVIILILAFSLVLLKMFRDKRKANILLAKQNIEIKTQKEEIATQRDIVIKQKEHIEYYNKKLTDSISYAKKIQEAVLPNSEQSRSILGNHFILFKPKDIVSGDFYWATQIDEWLIACVADCTGHGVPGAFMSMLGISFLNEIVRKKEITKTNDALNALRKEIIQALQQKGIQNEQKDGMDIAFVAINKQTLQCQYSGANNPLYIIKKKKTEIQEYELIELKPDKMPVAIHVYMESFTYNEIQLEKGDCLYLFSDGYADQFNGKTGKKFMNKRFKELLITNADKTMDEQKQILENTIVEWMGDTEQTDDITVMGLKI